MGVHCDGIVLLKKAHRKGFRGCIHSTFALPEIEQLEQASVLPRGSLISQGCVGTVAQ